MSLERETAEALSEGLNAIAGMLGENAPQGPSPQWAASLDAMENALDAIASNEMKTSLAVSQEQRERVRRLRGLAEEWTSSGVWPGELHEEGQRLLASFGLAVG